MSFNFYVAGNLKLLPWNHYEYLILFFYECEILEVECNIELTNVFNMNPVEQTT